MLSLDPDDDHPVFVAVDDLKQQREVDVHDQWERDEARQEPDEERSRALEQRPLCRCAGNATVADRDGDSSIINTTVAGTKI